MPMPSSRQGRRAARNGHTLEKTIIPVLTGKGFDKLPYSTWAKKRHSYGTELLLTNAPYTNIYGRNAQTEFLLKSARLQQDVRIECKWQQVSGSVDEKFPYLLLNCVLRMPEHEILIVVGGKGARPGSTEWLKDKCKHVTHKTIRVMTLEEFICWVNKTFE